MKKDKTELLTIMVLHMAHALSLMYAELKKIRKDIKKLGGK